MHDLTAFQRDLLYVIAGLDDPNGLAVAAELEDYYDREIQTGHLYPNLDTLVDKGLVSKRRVGPRTNAYDVTHRSCGELAAHREWKAQQGCVTRSD